jgi:Na+-driven multidrug efflux pump
VAAFTAAVKIDQAASMVLQSFGAAMTVYAAQNYGARKIDRIRKGLVQCAMMSGSYAVCIGFVFLFFGRPLAAIFLGPGSGEVLSMALRYLVITGVFYIFLSTLFVLRQTLQGLGDSVTPTIAGIMELVMRTFAAIILGKYWGVTRVSALPIPWHGPGRSSP